MIRFFFGLPGCGKSTLGVKLLRQNKFGCRNVLANYEVKDVIQFDVKDLATHYPPKNSYIVIDEAGIDYNNRKFKSMPMGTIEYFKLHRHNKDYLDFFSQSFDADVTITRLASEIWYVRALGPLTYARKIFPIIEIDKDSHQIITGYKFKSVIWSLLPFPLHIKQFMFCWRPSWYKYFDSYSLPYRPRIGEAAPINSKDDLSLGF